MSRRIGADIGWMPVRGAVRSPTGLSGLHSRLGLAASSEELFRALTEQAPIGVFVTDSAGSAVYANRRVCELTGLTEEQSLGHGWSAALHPDDAERVTAAWARASQAGDGFALEYRFLHADGSVTWVEGTASAIWDHGGLVGWVGVAVDLTERKAIEGRYLELFEQANDAVFTADTVGNFTAVNLAAQRISGFSREELLSKNVFELIAPEDVERGQQALAERLEGGPEEVVELQVVANDGRRVFVEVSGRLVLENGAPVRIEAIARDVTDRRSLQQQLMQQASHDALTGLPNRLLLFERLEQALARRERRKHGVAVLLLDLDSFKLVNDSLGHAAGDELLRAVAASLRRAIRPSDTAARLGGDEFAFLIDDIADEQAIVAIAERILASLTEVFLVDGGRQRVSGTLGIVVARSGDDAGGLLRSADTAMYQAKKKRRGGYEFFDAGMRSRVQRELTMRGALAEALERSALSLHYQPIVALDDGRLLGLEALVRWQHPQWGWVQPSEFIPIAEESGLIIPLSQYVIAEAGRQAAAWDSRYPGALPWGIAINLSPRELSEKNFLSEFKQALSKQGAKPSALTVEVTERSFLDLRRDALAENLFGLNQLGVRLSLDDFGTGYSALTSLQRFPFSVVKIDRFFIRRISDESREAPIADAITNLVHTLGMQVIAEGVETPAQAEFLRRIGCDAAQGFHFARPQPATDISARLQEQQQPATAQPQASREAAA